MFPDRHPSTEDECREYIVVANREDNAISWIDTDTEETLTPELPGFVPNYIWAPRDRDEVVSTDYFQGAVGIFNTRTRRMTDYVSFDDCDGSMHLFGNVDIDQLWVPCKISKTIKVMRYSSTSEYPSFDESVDLPAYEPHDVSVADYAAFVTWHGAADSYIARYSTGSFAKTGQLLMPNLTHTLYDKQNDWLYATAQGGGGYIFRLDPTTATPTIETQISLGSSPAHGFIFNDNFLYVGDFGANPAHIHKVRLSDFTLLTSWTLPIGNLHNLELAADSRKLFITRTAEDDVVAFDLDSNGNLDLSSLRTIYEAENPAGLYRLHRMCGFSKK